MYYIRSAEKSWVPKAAEWYLAGGQQLSPRCQGWQSPLLWLACSRTATRSEDMSYSIIKGMSVRGTSSHILPSLISIHEEFRDRFCSVALCFSNEHHSICLSLKHLPASGPSSLCPLSQVFHCAGFLFSLNDSYEPSCYDMKQSEDFECNFIVHGMSICGAGSLQLGLYVTYTE